MNRKNLFTATAVAETGTGILLLTFPGTVCWVLLGINSLSPESALLGRFAGAALVAIGLACWLARSEADNAAPRGLLIGVLIYDVAAAALLGHAGLILKFVGMALWPAVAAHVALAVWCVVCLRA